MLNLVTFNKCILLFTFPVNLFSQVWYVTLSETDVCGLLTYRLAKTEHQTFLNPWSDCGSFVVVCIHKKLQMQTDINSHSSILFAIITWSIHINFWTISLVSPYHLSKLSCLAVGSSSSEQVFSLAGRVLEKRHAVSGFSAVHAFAASR